MSMEFKRWLLEVGGNGGSGGGLTPPVENPALRQGAFADYHGPEGVNPGDQNGKLPPIKNKKKTIYKANGRTEERNRQSS
jgi:hypothetical protein